MVPDPEFMWLWIRRTRSEWPGQVWREREAQAYKRIYGEEQQFPLPLNKRTVRIICEDFARQIDWLNSGTGECPEWETDVGRAYGKASEQCGGHLLQSSDATKAWIWRKLVEIIDAEMSQVRIELDEMMERHGHGRSKTPIDNRQPSQPSLWDSV